MKKNVRDSIPLLVYGLAALAVMTAIFLFSQQGGTKSRELSETVLDGMKSSGLDIFTPVISLDGSQSGGGAHFRLEGRKWGHFYLFALLGAVEFLWWEKFIRVKSRPKGPLDRFLTAAALAFDFCLIYACADEFHQKFIDSREGRPLDVVYDALGFGLSILAVLLVFLLAALAVKMKRRIKAGKD